MCVIVAVSVESRKGVASRCQVAGREVSGWRKAAVTTFSCDLLAWFISTYKQSVKLVELTNYVGLLTRPAVVCDGHARAHKNRIQMRQSDVQGIRNSKYEV